MGAGPKDQSRLHPQTRLALAGRDRAHSADAVNPPIQRGSTVLFDDIETPHLAGVRSYGLEGLTTHDALCAALRVNLNAAFITLAPSGLGAISLGLLALTRAGGEVLITDSAYGPTRRLCDGLLKRHGIATRYYDPRIGAGIADLIHSGTCAVLLESPGSLTFEIQDIPAIAAAAKAANVPTLIDDTWSAGVYLNPFAHGVDVSIQALTKYQNGHADVLLGALATHNEVISQAIARTAKELGIGVGAAEDAYLTLRGMRTMHVRLAAQSQAALTIARWLEARPEVSRVLHPALPSHPDYALWARDFMGASGVFGVVLKPATRTAVRAMVEGYELFGIGYSWGGYESLVVVSEPKTLRTAVPWAENGALLRLSIGLEHPDDLIADLAAGFERLMAAM
jgi:cystathionine beta-lyase